MPELSSDSEEDLPDIVPCRAESALELEDTVLLEARTSEMSSSLRSRVLDDSRQRLIHLCHWNQMADFLNYLHRKKNSLKNPVRIKYVDQEGVDDTGLTKSLSSGLIQGMHDSLPGEDGAKVLPQDPYNMEEFGRMVGFILCHGGLKCPIFSPVFIKYICGAPVDIRVEDVPDPALRDLIRKVMAEPEGVTPSSNALELADMVGTARVQRQHLIKSALAYKVNVSNRASIDSFKTGLQELGVLSVLKENPEVACHLLCGDYQKAMSAEDIDSAFVRLYSEEGSNNRRLEQIMSRELSTFLQDCEDGDTGCTLADFLFFVAATRHIPPTGLVGDGGIATIQFMEGRRMPMASTCVSSLKLPRTLLEGMTFPSMMVMAIKSSPFIDNEDPH
ncbi:hypothetical protein V1264_024970 [Littorina saxatilis]|uniref:HECT domain-containing protein n=2 Tax=Littorina saxatilis TaxID=31220 RepID=A0AAN9AL01_9CAEN